MPNTKTVVSADVKQQILDRVKNDGAPVAQIAHEHGISDKTVYGWLSKGLHGQPTIMELSKLKRENKTLRELLGKLLFDAAMSQKNN